MQPLLRARVEIDAGGAQLPHHAVEGGGAALGAANVVVALRRVLEQFERPAVGAVAEQTAQRETHLDRVDARL